MKEGEEGEEVIVTAAVTENTCDLQSLKHLLSMP